jgi:hypothetical protein
LRLLTNILYFAVNADLVPIFEAVERVSPLKYVNSGHFRGDQPITILRSGREIANLGTASADSGIACDSYLICHADREIVPRPRPGSDKIICIDQLLNPESVMITPAGALGGEIVLAGCVATVSSSDQSQELMKRFHLAMSKAFRWASPCFIGPNALEWLKSGKRLTLTAQSPADCDFHLS